MIVNAVSFGIEIADVSNPVVVGYMLNNQGKRIKCQVKTDYKGNIIFSPVEPIEESDLNDIS